MAIQQAQCSCGTAVEIRTGADMITTMRRDGKQAVYPEDENKGYSIFRCKVCLQPLDQTCPAYEYDEPAVTVKPPEPTAIETAALRWHRARKVLQQAKDALKAYREEHGGCEFEGADNGDREPKGICYQDTQHQDDWCPTCQGSELLFQAKRKAGQEQGAAMRSLMNLCEKEHTARLACQNGEKERKCLIE